MNSSAAKIQDRFYIVDLLRFSAAIAVVFYHYCFRGWADDNFSPLVFPQLASIFKYGYLGVELFFIISGFVIYLSILHATPTKFVIGRISRLYPAFWFCVSLTYLAIVLSGVPQFKASFFQYLYNLSMVSGYLYLPHIDGVYWTLLIEIKFYFIMFCVLSLKAKRYMVQILFTWLTIVALHRFELITLPNSIEFFLFPDYASYFISGVLFYLLYQQGHSAVKYLLLIGCYLIGLDHAYVDMQGLSDKYHTEFNFYVIASILAGFYIVFWAVARQKLSVEQSGKITLMGALTYPLYLIHQNIGFIIFNLTNGMVNKYIILIATIIFVLLLAYWIHTHVEKPFAKWLKNQLNLISARFSLASEAN